MLSLSQGVGYAVKALAYLNEDESGLFVKDIAERAEVPPAYLAKVFKKLVDHNILVSKRGWAGGTRLARSPKKINLLEITEAVDGKDWGSCCLLGQEICSDERACPTHDFWKVERKAIAKKLNQITLAECIEFEHKRRARSKGQMAQGLSK